MKGIELPGFVNAHSHAFQRALRGRVEVRSTQRPHDDFWSWRTAMYADAARVTPDDVEALAAWAYLDMLRAGFTAVGEFHYLHHDVDARTYAGPEMSLRLAKAAARVGIRLVLLETAYARGGHQRPLTPPQQRFAFASVDAFFAHVNAVRAAAGASVGVAIHSVRACPREWIEAIAEFASRHALPLHVHACEQRKEIAECQAEHGLSPIALLDACGALGAGTTVVHATHVDDNDVRLLADRGATVCVTPSTERNLGDGLCPLSDLFAAGVPVCVGTDSHARIDVVDELRSLEDHERLRLERRNVLVPPGKRLADILIPCGTTHGRRSLGLDDDRGDRVRIRAAIEGVALGEAVARDAWLVGGSSCDVTDVWVGGELVIAQGAPTRVSIEDVEGAALDVLKRLG